MFHKRQPPARIPEPRIIPVRSAHIWSSEDTCGDSEFGSALSTRAIASESKSEEDDLNLQFASEADVAAIIASTFGNLSDSSDHSDDDLPYIARAHSSGVGPASSLSVIELLESDVPRRRAFAIESHVVTSHSPKNGRI
jgi:hypothetical protein